jgi:hypothetical protein
MKTLEEIQKLADKYTVFDNEDLHDGYVDGYTQCQRDNEGNKYTEEDIISIVNKSRSTRLTVEHLILQLNINKQTRLA